MGASNRGGNVRRLRETRAIGGGECGVKEAEADEDEEEEEEKKRRREEERSESNRARSTANEG